MAATPGNKLHTRRPDATLSARSCKTVILRHITNCQLHSCLQPRPISTTDACLDFPHCHQSTSYRKTLYTNCSGVRTLQGSLPHVKSCSALTPQSPAQRPDLETVPIAYEKQAGTSSCTQASWRESKQLIQQGVLFRTDRYKLRTQLKLPSHSLMGRLKLKDVPLAVPRAVHAAWHACCATCCARGPRGPA